jgi:hypothetical protein
MPMVMPMLVPIIVPMTVPMTVPMAMCIFAIWIVVMHEQNHNFFNDKEKKDSQNQKSGR